MWGNVWLSIYTSNERWGFFITGTITSGKLKKDIVKGSMCGGNSDLLL